MCGGGGIFDGYGIKFVIILLTIQIHSVIITDKSKIEKQ